MSPLQLQGVSVLVTIDSGLLFPAIYAACTTSWCPEQASHGCEGNGGQRATSAWSNVVQQGLLCGVLGAQSLIYFLRVVVCNSSDLFKWTEHLF